MTKERAENMRRLYNRLEAFGFTSDETDTLCRIQNTLTRWAELECGDSDGMAYWAIERDETTGKPYYCVHPYAGNSRRGPTRRTPIADREAGALRRLRAIMAFHPEYLAYHQGDPRGCVLYIVAKTDIPEGQDIDSYYTNGVAVCY